jgi:bifunctional UDP-N-acetylglucosamine pyrophosphorylase/glucosamine-1-phosphate N-acetyltransferase
VNARHGAASLAAIVLAAGEGKRMRTVRAKVLHEAGGRALLDHVLAALEPLAPAPLVVVVGHLREQVEAHLAGRGAVLAVQEPPKGTGDAVARALPHLPDDGETLVLSGDVPLITPKTLKALLELRRSRGAAAALVSAVPAEPGSYGRIVRDDVGEVIGIVEARDVTPAQRGIGEVNAGMYVFDLAALRRSVGLLRPDNDQGEYYLTDTIGILASEGHGVAALRVDDPAEMAGVNSRADLAEVHSLLNARVVRHLQEAGVTVLDPATTWVDADCTVGRDTVLEAGVHLRRGCAVGVRCRIGAHAVLDGVSVPDDGVVAPLTHRCGK